MSRNRLPTLFEVLNRKSQSPVDLWSFYVFMREEYRGVHYLDFWLDVVNHLSLCRHYVSGLRESVLHSERENTSSRTSSVLLDTLIQDGVLDDVDSHRLSEFLRREDSGSNSDALGRLSSLLEALNSKHKGLDEINIPNSRRESRQNKEKPSKSRMLNRSESPELKSGSGRTPELRSSGARTQLGMSSEYMAVDNDAATYSPSRVGSPHSRVLLAKRGAGSRDTSQSTRSGSAGRLLPDDFDEKNKSQVLVNDYNDDDDDHRHHHHVSDDDVVDAAAKALSAETIERLFPRRHGDIEDGGSYVTRSDVRQSAQKILTTFFIQDAERELALPSRIMLKVRQAIENDGRDDPEVFDEAREYVFQALEREVFPLFLAARALGNVTPVGSLVRLIIGVFAFFAAFWAGFALIFLDYTPRPTRLWLIVPFAVGAYGVCSSLYNLDPLMAFFGVSESTASAFTRVRELYVRKLLVKRAIYISCVAILTTLVFVLIFALVPGKRL